MASKGVRQTERESKQSIEAPQIQLKLRRSLSIKKVEEDLNEAFKAGLKEFLEKSRVFREETKGNLDTITEIPVIQNYL